jgi:signal transduction histidine kinase
VISVSDTGVGLDPDRVDKIFSAFFTTKDHGTGMGRGATFPFNLPAAAAAQV